MSPLLPSSNDNWAPSAFQHHNCLFLQSLNSNSKILHFSFQFKPHFFSYVIFITASTGFLKLVSISPYHLAFCKANAFCWELFLTSRSSFLFIVFHLLLGSPVLNFIINMCENSEPFFLSLFPYRCHLKDNFVSASSSYVFL